MAVISSSLMCLFLSIVQNVAAVPVDHPLHLSQELTQTGGESLDSSEAGEFFPVMMDDDSVVFVPVPYMMSNEPFSVSDNEEESPKSRVKRQIVDRAMELSLSHNDRNGNPRPVGRLHGYGEMHTAGNSRNHYNTNLGVGVGAVAWRSRNNRHSVGLGVAAEQNRGRWHGYRYQTKPNVGFGVGYRWRF